MKTQINADFLDVVNQRSGQVIQRCYFCKKCATGCPVVSYYDYLPYELFRMMQFGLKEEVLKSSTLWLCSTCGTCTTRCPNNIDIANVIDTLKEISVEEGIKAGERDIKLFHLLFLDNIRRFGRIHEATLLGLLKFRTGNIFKDLILGFKLFKKGKLKLKPERIEGKDEIRLLSGLFTARNR